MQSMSFFFIFSHVTCCEQNITYFVCLIHFTFLSHIPVAYDKFSFTTMKLIDIITN